MNFIMSDRAIFLLNLPENTEFINLKEQEIKNCIGCFGCWVKTPAKCVLDDDAKKIYPIVAKSQNLMYITRIKYGTYDVPMKQMLERNLPTQQAFIRLYEGETHHYQRNVNEKDAVIIAYGDIDDKDKRIFEKLVARNAKNMIFKNYKIIFSSEENVDKKIDEELELWKK